MLHEKVQPPKHTGSCKGYQQGAESHSIIRRQLEWIASRYRGIVVQQEHRLAPVLSHLYTREYEAGVSVSSYRSEGFWTVCLVAC